MNIYIIKNFIKNIYWGIFGIFISNPILPKHVNSILFICKGNICRSIFAEKIAEKHQYFSKKYKIDSAGIQAENQMQSPTEALIVAKHFGIDIDNHVSKKINYNMLESNDVLIAMDASHFKFLRNLFPEFTNKIYLLPLFNKNKIIGNYSTYNIKDPYGRGITEFEECIIIIDIYIKKLFLMLNNCEQ